MTTIIVKKHSGELTLSDTLNMIEKINMQIVEVYQNLARKYEAEVEVLSRRHRQISGWRLLLALTAIGGIYLTIRFESFTFILLVLIAVIVFIVVIRLHDAVVHKKKIKEALLQINQDEIAFLEGQDIPFEDGKKHLRHDHDYAHDLDLFGPQSLYHHLNRTGTFTGSDHLAMSLLTPLVDDQIVGHQKAIAELSDKLNWRQKLRALTMLHGDDAAIMDFLKTWSGNQKGLPKSIIVLGHIIPVFFWVSVLLLIIFKEPIYFNIVVLWLIVNLSIFGSQFKLLKREASEVSEIDKIIKKYGILLHHIEEKTFHADVLTRIQGALKDSDHRASKSMIDVAHILGKIDSIYNGMAVLFLSGTSQYHLHKLQQLFQWKAKYGPSVSTWVEAVGKIEMLSSYACFFYNNPDFIFPRVNQDYTIKYSDLGHPLIGKSTRVTNDVSFVDHRFIILTGSNMSGKSTFLRSLGIGMVLTRAGAPICAREADVHPLPVFVSMRLSDSLADSESFFFVEVKRLRNIMDHLNQSTAFVLLDEILRGTNSDDKRKGTVEVIKKLIEKRAIGAIATHDLEVCNIVAKFPSYLVNQCFEVEIIDNDLHFDYKLRAGICQNQSASFLMKKMQII